jgi:hypothetical protein
VRFFTSSNRRNSPPSGSGKGLAGSWQSDFFTKIHLAQFLPLLARSGLAVAEREIFLSICRLPIIFST